MQFIWVSATTHVKHAQVQLKTNAFNVPHPTKPFKINTCMSVNVKLEPTLISNAVSSTSIVSRYAIPVQWDVSAAFLSIIVIVANLDIFYSAENVWACVPRDSTVWIKAGPPHRLHRRENSARAN